MSNKHDDFNMPWFHNITRERTEKLLKGCCDGTFLIRKSTNFPGDFTLCVASESKVEHYRIYSTNGQFTCDNEELFDSLIQLVQHYKRDSDGLCHRLTTPIISDTFKSVHDSSTFDQKRKEFGDAGLLLSINDLVFGNVIGHGEFGDVLYGAYKSQKVAVKTLKNGISFDLLAEAEFMIGLHHTNLVELIGVVLESEQDVYMVTEYMANGNLVDFLRSRGRQQVDVTQLILFALDVAQGMAYMESLNFVHRDLAARNILLDENLVAKISDFGLAYANNNSSTKTSITGKFPVKWTAPEALRQSPIQEVVRHIERGYRMEAPEGCPSAIAIIMTECWALHPNERPSFEQILPKLRKIAGHLII